MIKTCFVNLSRYLCTPEGGKQFFKDAEVAQLVEHDLAKVGVASPSLVFRSIYPDHANDPDFFCPVVMVGMVDAS